MGFRLKLDVQAQGCGRILDVAGQGGEGSRKLDNFHGRHIFIVRNAIKFACATSYLFPSLLCYNLVDMSVNLGALFVLILNYLVSKRKAP